METCEVENFEKLTNGRSPFCVQIFIGNSTETQIAEYSRVRGAFHFVCPDNDEPFPIGMYNTQDMMTINNSVMRLDSLLKSAEDLRKIQPFTTL